MRTRRLRTVPPEPLGGEDPSGPLLRLRGLEEENARLAAVIDELRAEAEGAATCLARSQKLAAALGAAMTRDESAAAALRAIRLGTEADGAAIWLLTAGGEALELVATDGSSPQAWPERLAADSSLALCECVRTGVAVMIDAGSDPLPEPALGPRAILPLAVDGRGIGAIWLSFAGDRRFSAVDRALLQSAAAQVSLAFARTRPAAAGPAPDSRREPAGRREGELQSALGHELRNPLAAIQSALDLMRLRAGAPTGREQEVIDRQVQRMVQVLDELREVTRLRRGDLQLQRRPVELAAVIRTATAAVSGLLAERGHRLQVDVPATGRQVLGDQDRLVQVFTDLLVDAARATERDGWVHVGCVGADGHIIVHVRDGGRRNLTRPGLRVAIARELVDLHDGSMSATSDDAGTVDVVVRLPAA